ncbi:Extracellular sulfatase SULF-1-like protein [Bienertia sinuspersici]
MEFCKFYSKSHPITYQLLDNMSRMRSSQATLTASLTDKLTDLKDLYQCVDEFLQLPLRQKRTDPRHTISALKKIIKRCLKDIKEVEKTNEANTTESLLKEVKAVTVDVIKSLLASLVVHSKVIGLYQN